MLDLWLKETYIKIIIRYIIFMENNAGLRQIIAAGKENLMT